MARNMLDVLEGPEIKHGKQNKDKGLKEKYWARLREAGLQRVELRVPIGRVEELREIARKMREEWDKENGRSG